MRVHGRQAHRDHRGLGRRRALRDPARPRRRRRRDRRRTAHRGAGRARRLRGGHGAGPGGRAVRRDPRRHRRPGPGHLDQAHRPARRGRLAGVHRPRRRGLPHACPVRRRARGPGPGLFIFEELRRENCGAADLARLARRVAEGRLEVKIDLTTSWRDADTAIRALREGRIAGKAVLTVD
ncbi:zinc-binding dehydrogenase [Baekduia soli]|uniref:zinc-binding dehydrogenase n=1 Tax=Baekduia soli TaxID=496014 RepID=UPI00389914C8